MAGGVLSGSSVGDISARNFGLLIAYVLPGFIALWGVGYTSEAVRTWLIGAGSAGPSVGAFLYVLLGSIACGMTASVIRWAILDTLHHSTGLKKPVLNFSRFQTREDAFERVVAYHYQYYQFYGNTLVALLFTYPVWRAHTGGGGLLADSIFMFILVVFIAGSRDALRLFYRRASQLLGESPEVSHDKRRRRREARSRTRSEGGKQNEGSPGKANRQDGEHKAPEGTADES